MWIEAEKGTFSVSDPRCNLSEEGEEARQETTFDARKRSSTLAITISISNFREKARRMELGIEEEGVEIRAFGDFPMEKKLMRVRGTPGRMESG